LLYKPINKKGYSVGDFFMILGLLALIAAFIIVVMMTMPFIKHVGINSLGVNRFT